MSINNQQQHLKDSISKLQVQKNVILFYCPEFEFLAKSIADGSQGKIQLGNITWRQFQDGFPNLFIEDAEQIRNHHVAFLASFHSPENIFEQLAVIYALPRLFIQSFKLVLPYFPTGTMERMDLEGQIPTAVTLARMLTAIPTSRGGPTSLVIFDIHALQERFYFGDTLLPLFQSGIPLLKRKLKTLADDKNITIAYPDEGSQKRFHTMFPEYPEIICTKVRDGNKRIVRLKEGEPKGRHVVIIDDLVQTGGTLIECAKLIEGLDAQYVSCYVTHGVFPKDSWKRFQQQANGKLFKYFWITDSCPQIIPELFQQEPFEILSLAEPICEALQT